MPRHVPPEIRDDLASGVTTFCWLLRIASVQPGVAPYGVTGTNRDVRYDDGRGELVYSAAVATEPTAIQGGADLSVDNAESRSLIPEFDVPIREADIRAGVYDFADFDLYLINYDAPIPGRHVRVHSGTIGQVSIDDDGLSFVNELRGLSATLRQSICQKDSLSCRATFGSQPHATLIAGPLERFPCGVNATALLVAGEVASVGLENTLTFALTTFTGTANEYVPGMVFWLTGMNAGRAHEIGSNTAGGVLTLAIETDWPIQVGDTLQYRVDCNKQARDEVKGCKAPIRWGDAWPLHFRGEPDIPIGDAGAMETPGASSAPGIGGAVRETFSTEAE